MFTLQNTKINVHRRFKIKTEEVENVATKSHWFSIAMVAETNLFQNFTVNCIFNTHTYKHMVSRTVQYDGALLVGRPWTYCCFTE